MKLNSDGSARLGTLQTSQLMALAISQNIDTTAVRSSIELVDAAVSELVTVIKRDLDNKLKVRILPNEPASVENVEVPFLLDTYVSYMKRKNPTRSASTKAQAAEAAKAAYSHRKNSLIAQLHDVEKGSEEEKAILDQLIAM